MGNYITIKEAAARGFGSYEGLKKQIQRGTLPFVRDGRSYLIDPYDLDLMAHRRSLWIKQFRQPPASVVKYLHTP